MNIYGKNVVLRAVQKEDAPFLLELINDPDTEKMVGGYSFPVSPESQARWIEHAESNSNTVRCIVAKKEDIRTGIGTVILSNIDWKNGIAGINIKMDAEAGRGKGYATDAVNTILAYAFSELRLNCVYANVLEYNLKSQKLFERCRFKQDGVLRARTYKAGKYHDVIAYSITKKDLEYDE